MVNDRLVWVDCEMTGLSLATDKLIEIAALVTDSDLNILGDGIEKFVKFSVSGTELNKAKIASYVGESLMLVTALSPVIGYQNAAHIAENALAENQTLKQAALASGHVTEEQFDSIVVPADLVGHGVLGA